MYSVCSAGASFISKFILTHKYPLKTEPKHRSNREIRTVSSQKCLCIAEDGPAPQPWGHEPCVHLASPCSLFRSMLTRPDLPLLPPLQCQQPHFGFKHQDTGSCGWRSGGGGDGPSPGLPAETQLRDRSPNRGPWPGYTPEALSIHRASLDKRLCISTFILQHFPSPWDTEHWWLTMEHWQCINFEYE